MAALQDIKDTLGELLRTSAAKYGAAASEYGAAASEYGAAFVAFGKGDMTATRVAETALRLSGREAVRVAETGAALGLAYAKWASSLVGVENLSSKVKPQPVKPQAAVHAATPRPAATKPVKRRKPAK
jgi:hypothetical protein